jgi:pyrimidine-nucleoside phosphorylase
VGDKTTLVIAPVVAACGVKIAKMSGRGLGHTGGTIDKMESVPGTRTALSQEDFFAQVNKIGLSVIGQSEGIAVADKKMYALRDVTATVSCIPLIASSIMSKKLASGSDAILLDVTTGTGAFMKTVDQSIELAKLMVSIGTHHGRRVAAMITDMDTPLGHNIGNSLEVMESMDVLKGKGPADLTEVCLQLAANMLVLAGKGTPTECRAMAEAVIADGSAFAKCKEMFAAQGGDIRVLDDYDRFEKPAARYELLAEQDGYITANDAEKIGSASVLLGAGRIKKEDSIDFAAGIIMHKSAATTSTRARAWRPSTAQRTSSLPPPRSTAAALSTAPKSPKRPRWCMPSSPKMAWNGIKRSNKRQGRDFSALPFVSVLLLYDQPTEGNGKPQKNEAGPGLPENVPDRTHERAGGNHQQTVGYVVHADESGPLVTGDGIVQQSVLVQEPGTQYAFGQHTTQNAHQCRRGTHAEASDAAEQGTEGIKPPETVQVDSTTPFRTQHSSQIAEQ